ncbi:hypothetical protein FB567DRAFT_253500 [Paraphoma chrysanthemicola]|uniref:Uncharacterized protein n=1 Tax=Paraphoma chrysanthemicola TaxID=798071 RepID=A0A8K0VRL1_9PLEO|nr:hypothetical protein FB567DRAFT_253500 [Paraphoma chrysanthemicola]
MSCRSTRSANSQTASISSSTSMTPAPSRQSPHPYLTPGRASTISTWQSTLSERNSQAHISSKGEEESRRAAFEAYQQLRMSLFSRAATTTTSPPN